VISLPTLPYNLNKPAFFIKDWVTKSSVTFMEFVTDVEEAKFSSKKSLSSVELPLIVHLSNVMEFIVCDLMVMKF
jgi:hypothetical protein